MVSTGSGPGAGRATLSSLAGLTSLWRNASSSRLRLGVSSAECGYSFPVYLAYFFEVLGLQLSIRHWMSSTFSGPARGPAGPKEPGREGRGTARRGEGQDFDCGGRRHGMAISTMFRRARVLGPRDGSSFHQAAGQPPDVAQPHGLIVQLLDAHVDVPVAARQSCWRTCPWMFTQPGGSPSRLPTPFPPMQASCAAFNCRGRAPTLSVAAGCASVTGRPPPPRPECS